MKKKPANKSNKPTVKKSSIVTTPKQVANNARKMLKEINDFQRGNR
jgi:hypothetical protein